MKKTRIQTIVVLVLCSTIAVSQRANNWFFGNNAGLSFNSNPPIALTNGLVNNADNTSTISNSAGNLLFYTNGVTVWNKNHVIMPNGTGLTGHVTAGQCALILPIPCDTNKYVIFHVTEFSSPGYLSYTLVDMSLNGGLGDVVPAQKNISLGTGWTEKLCAYYNPAGNYFWLLSHKWQSDQFVAFRVDASSIATQSVVSAIGSAHSCGAYSGAHDAMGQLTISPDGSKVINALTCQDKFELFDFNLNTGILTNLISIPGNGGYAWGTAFSPDNTKLYTNSILGQSVFQYDLTAYNQPAIVASKFTLYIAPTGGYNFGYMELGPDNKLYIAKPGTQNLIVISNPNNLGAASNFNLAGPSLSPNTSSHGLSRIAYNIPNSIQSPVLISASSTSLCPGQSATLTATGGFNYVWNGAVQGPTISVSPAVSTNYSVTASGGCSSTASIQINILSSPTLSTNGPLTICHGQNALLTADGANTYVWSNGASGPSIYLQAPVSGNYSVTGTNADGCSSQAVIVVNVMDCVGINEASGSLAGRIYPNPVADQLEIITGAGVNAIRIMDAFGQLAYHVEQPTQIQGKISLQLSFLPSGVYFVTLIGNEGASSHKILKK